MRVAYLTTDEVNEALALDMAHTCGVAFEPLVPKQGLPDARYDAVLIDWDHWPPEGRAAFLAELCDALPPWRVVIHGYYLEDGPAETLRARGVVVHRQLQPEVIRLLREAITAASSPDASADGRDRLDARDHPERPPVPFAGIGS